jgi:hypothetical protein
LREIFSNHTYDELQNLSIVFAKKGKSKRKGGKKKVNEEKETMEKETPSLQNNEEELKQEE